MLKSIKNNIYICVNKINIYHNYFLFEYIIFKLEKKYKKDKELFFI
jgi:hypothetical protein